MKKINYYDIIFRQLLTEKSSILLENSKYVFLVDTRATKSDIAEAITHIFSVEVCKVNTINVAGKVKRFRGKVGKSVSYKKAVDFTTWL